MNGCKYVVSFWKAPTTHYIRDRCLLYVYAVLNEDKATADSDNGVLCSLDCVLVGQITEYVCVCGDDGVGLLLFIGRSRAVSQQILSHSYRLAFCA